MRTHYNLGAAVYDAAAGSGGSGLGRSALAAGSDAAVTGMTVPACRSPGRRRHRPEAPADRCAPAPEAPAEPVAPEVPAATDPEPEATPEPVTEDEQTLLDLVAEADAQHALEPEDIDLLREALIADRKAAEAAGQVLPAGTPGEAVAAWLARFAPGVLAEDGITVTGPDPLDPISVAGVGLRRQRAAAGARAGAGVGASAGGLIPADRHEGPGRVAGAFAASGPRSGDGRQRSAEVGHEVGGGLDADRQPHQGGSTARAESATEEWVMRAGCSIRDSTAPRTRPE
jgi:hypothetical protein